MTSSNPQPGIAAGGRPPTPDRDVAAPQIHLAPPAPGRSRAGRLRADLEAGMSTAEYAVGTVAACGFAALLWTILHSAVVEHALSGLITRALGMV